jgi:hypothetical protein
VQFAGFVVNIEQEIAVDQHSPDLDPEKDSLSLEPSERGEERKKKRIQLTEPNRLLLMELILHSLSHSPKVHKNSSFVVL